MPKEDTETNRQIFGFFSAAVIQQAVQEYEQYKHTNIKQQQHNEEHKQHASQDGESGHNKDRKADNIEGS